MSCKIFQTEIGDRDWNVPLSLTTREHLDGCAECRKIHDEQTSLRILIGELEKVSAPADFESRLRSRIAAAEKAGRSSSAWRPRFSPAFSPNAASLALAAAFVLTSALTLRYARLDQADPSYSNTPMIETATKTPATLRAVTSEEAGTPEPPARPAIEETVAGRSADNQHVAAHRRKTVGGQIRTARSVAAPSNTEAAAGGSNTMVVTTAPVVSARAAVAIPVSSGVRPVSFTLRNERGAAQRVSIEPVSFGTQELVGRFNNLARGTSSAGEGVW